MKNLINVINKVLGKIKLLFGCSKVESIPVKSKSQNHIVKLKKLRQIRKSPIKTISKEKKRPQIYGQKPCAKRKLKSSLAKQDNNKDNTFPKTNTVQATIKICIPKGKVDRYDILGRLKGEFHTVMDAANRTGHTIPSIIDSINTGTYHNGCRWVLQ